MVAFLPFQILLLLLVHYCISASLNSVLREIARHFLLTHQQTASKRLMLNQAGSTHGVEISLLETAVSIFLEPAVRQCSTSSKTAF